MLNVGTGKTFSVTTDRRRKQWSPISSRWNITWNRKSITHLVINWIYNIDILEVDIALDVRTWNKLQCIFLHMLNYFLVYNISCIHTSIFIYCKYLFALSRYISIEVLLKVKLDTFPFLYRRKSFKYVVQI
jgi:hypothetical protein